MRLYIYCGTLKHMVPPCDAWDSPFCTPQPLCHADTGTTWIPAAPSRSHPSLGLTDAAMAGVCFTQQKHVLAQWHWSTGEVSTKPGKFHTGVSNANWNIDLLTLSLHGRVQQKTQQINNSSSFLLLTWPYLSYSPKPRDETISWFKI